jgi:hypothetical protein
MDITEYKIEVYYYSNPVRAVGINDIFIYKNSSSACVLLDVVRSIYVEYELYVYIKDGYPSAGINGLFFIKDFTRVNSDREIKYLLNTISYLESIVGSDRVYNLELTHLGKLIEVYNTVLNKYIFET